MTLPIIADRYFAAAPDNLLGDKLWSRFEASQTAHTPRAARWWAALQHYYGDETEAGQTWAMSRRGEAGELAAIRINRARRGSKARQQLILSGRVAFRARCRTQDADAAQAQLISQTWLEHDFRENGMEQLWRQGVEYSEVFSEAYSFTEFDRTRGSDVQLADRVAKDGVPRTTLLPPWLVSSDNSVTSPADRSWWFVNLSRPKPDLTMLYRKVRRGAEWLTGEAAERAIWDAKPLVTPDRYGDDLDESAADNAEVIVFIHHPTIRFPLGRFVRMLGPDCVLEDRPLIGKHGDYDETSLPLQRLAADEMAGTPHAWSTFFDVMATQELLDGIDTGAATTVTGFATPLYAIERGGDEKSEKLALGMRTWRMGPMGKKPELIERPEVPESLLRYREELGTDMDKAFSVNSDSTGQTDSKEKNAQAEALRASMSLQQVSTQSSDSRTWLRKTMECRLKTLRKNAQGERLLRAVGESQRHLVETSRFFTARQLEPLDSVELEESNPLEDTPQGRQAMLDYLGEHGLIKSQEDVEAVMRTGKLAKATNAIRDENMLIDAENEMIQRGEMPMVYPSQNGVLHMRQHMCTTLSVAALRNDKVLQTHDAHEREHWFVHFGVDRDTDPLYFPRMQFIKGLGPDPMAPVAPPAARTGTPAPQPGEPSGTQPPAQGETTPTQPSQPGTPSPVQPQGGQPPVEMPTNPLTKAPFQPTAAGQGLPQ